MQEIGSIYKVNYMRDSFSYVGCCRNERKFNINDLVFFTLNKKEIFYGRIIGIELPLAENPEYHYKIELPIELSSEVKDSATLICDDIFYTAEEAKKSAITNLEWMYTKQKEEIDKYFDRFLR